MPVCQRISFCDSDNQRQVDSNGFCFCFNWQLVKVDNLANIWSKERILIILPYISSEVYHITTLPNALRKCLCFLILLCLGQYLLYLLYYLSVYEGNNHPQVSWWSFLCVGEKSFCGGKQYLFNKKLFLSSDFWPHWQ